MGDSNFRKIQKILEKPEPPAHMRERNYRVVIPWYQRWWDSMRPPSAVPSEGKPMNRSQRRILILTAAIVLPIGLGWWGYSYIAGAPDRARAAYDAGMKAQGANDFGRAATSFSESLEISPSAKAFLHRGNAYRELRQPEKSLADWTQAIAMDPALVDAFTARATYYRQIGDLAKALEDLDASIRIEPSVDAHYQRGQVYSSLGQLDKAIEDYDQAIERRRDAPYVYLARAAAKRALGDEEGYRQDQQIAATMLR